jgi:hypothetical protein
MARLGGPEALEETLAAALGLRRSRSAARFAMSAT